MDDYRRPQFALLLQRLREPPLHIVAIFGPRQTGKTTLVRQALVSTGHPYRYISVDEPDPSTPSFTETLVGETTFPVSQPRDTRWLVRNWEEARHHADREPDGFVLAIDEIQKIPNWSETVKGLWDADRASGRRLHVIILGSAPLLMQSGLAESLAGRFEPVRVTHWSFQEAYDAFDFTLDQYLYFGGYPGAAPFVHDQQRWRDYIVSALIEPNIERDILAMTRVDKPALLKRLFELGAASSGQMLSFTKMLGQLQDAGNTTTLARYLDLLSNAGLLTGLQNWANQPFRRRASSPKLNVLNTALMTAGSGYSLEEAQADRTFWGRIVESAVGAHLINSASSDIHVHYWRQQPFEVDFILQRADRVVAFEVKSGQNTGELRGLEEFQKRFHPRDALVVGAGGIALNEFLATPAAEWLE